MKNYMEVLVESHLPLILAEYPHIKDCLICQNDLKAMALNSLKPHYVNNDLGLIFTKLKELDQQFQSDIIQEMVRAADKVANSPHCKVNM